MVLSSSATAMQTYPAKQTQSTWQPPYHACRQSYVTATCKRSPRLSSEIRALVPCQLLRPNHRSPVLLLNINIYLEASMTNLMSWIYCLFSTINPLYVGIQGCFPFSVLEDNAQSVHRGKNSYRLCFGGTGNRSLHQ